LNSLAKDLENKDMLPSAVISAVNNKDPLFNASAANIYVQGVGSNATKNGATGRKEQGIKINVG